MCQPSQWFPGAVNGLSLSRPAAAGGGRRDDPVVRHLLNGRK
jgi:hypothetical protein